VERNNPPFMSGVPELLLLRLLADDELYGYEIVRKVRGATGDAISLGEGVVYPVLHALEAAGALRSRRRLVNGRERQSYPVSDMVFSPAQLVSLISRDLTLVAGDVITCGTSLGVGPLKPGNTVEVVIDGIGTLGNRYGE